MPRDRLEYSTSRDTDRPEKPCRAMPTMAASISLARNHALASSRFLGRETAAFLRLRNAADFLTLFMCSPATPPHPGPGSRHSSHQLLRRKELFLASSALDNDEFYERSFMKIKAGLTAGKRRVPKQ